MYVSVSPIYGGTIEIRTGQVDGPLNASVQVEGSRALGMWRTVSAPVEPVGGVHDLYFVFRGEKDLFYFDWWQFSK